MGFVHYHSGRWNGCAHIRYYSGSGWVSAERASRFDGTSWRSVWQPPGTYSVEYPLTDYATYEMNSGRRVTDLSVYHNMPVILQGQAVGTTKLYSTMLFFPLDEILLDLSGTSIDSISLKMYVVEGSGLFDDAYLLIHYGGGYTSPPDRWRGADSGDADVSIPEFPERTLDTTALNISVGEALRDGQATFISFNSAGRTSDTYYTIIDASSVRLCITYSRA